MTGVVQRWRDRKTCWRPAEQLIVTADYEVASIPDDVTARAFVTAHHYSGSYPAARRRFGLYRKGRLTGIAVFSVPMHQAVLKPLPGSPSDSAELGRLVLLDDVPGNGETWFLGRCFSELRREGWTGVVSFSDPVPRTNVSGSRVFVGHIGTIYQAFNGVYLGRGSRNTLALLPDGLILSRRAQSKIRTRDQGWRYAALLLENHGAAPLLDGEDAAAWLSLWRKRLTRPLRHPGNHKYAWAIDRRARRFLPHSLPYPKQMDAAVAPW